MSKSACRIPILLKEHSLKIKKGPGTSFLATFFVHCLTMQKFSSTKTKEYSEPNQTFKSLITTQKNV